MEAQRGASETNPRETGRSCSPRISLIVPAYNEEKYLPALLDSVEAARARYRGEPGDIEVIVADDGSTDGTAALAEARGCRVVRVAARCIAGARNAGARVARGEIVAFVDADSRIHPETFNAIAETMSGDRIVAGMTGVTMERWSAGIAVTYALMVPLVWLTGFDTGVVFCRRADFEALGGYDETLKVAEDVKLLLALRRLGKRTGRRLKRVTRIKAIASARKFDAHGEWHYLRLLILAPYYLSRARRPDSFLDRYWYRPDR